MKKILVLILTICIFNTPKPILANESIFELQNYPSHFETTVKNELANNTDAIPPAVMKFVILVVQNIAWDITKEVAGYLWSYEPDYKVVEDWTKKNGYDHIKFEILSKDVVYDNGCWKPEFPANPFCKALSKS